MNRLLQGLAAAVGAADVQGAYTGLRNARLVLGAKNLFDKQPPVAIAEPSTLYVFQQHSLRGLFVYASVNYKFR